MIQYRADYADDGVTIIRCSKYDYTPNNMRFVRLDELLDVLNECTSDTAYDRVVALIHDLTKAIPGSE